MNTNVPGFMICSRAGPDTPYHCAMCGQAVSLSADGRRRMQQTEDSGVRLYLACNKCGGEIISFLTAKAQADPALKVQMEILPKAISQIQARDPEFLEWLKKRAAEKDTKP